MTASAHIPVILVTALREDASRAMGIVAGADGYFTVPIDFIALIARMRSLLRQRTGGGGGQQLSRNFEKSLHRALAYANERRHEYASLEHLLLALTEDQDAVAVLRACGVDLDRLRREVLNYVDNELGNLVAAHDDDAKPTASFQRVLQRAAIHVQSSGREEVTGANVLVAMFAERESHAVYYLQEQDMTRFDAVNYISYGIPKAPGRSETRRDQEEERTEGVRFPMPNTRETPAVDETKLIAAILCARMILPDDVAADPIATTVDFYERILAELRARGHAGTEGKRTVAATLVDPLTGAFNRRYLEAQMPKLFARCRSAHKPLAVLIIDIDHLKRINDAHGHAVGDHVLKEIVNRATIALRPLDLVARMGGEEFAVVMPEKDLDAALQIAERLRGRIGDTLVEGADCTPPFTVTVSIGVSVAQPDREEEPWGAFRRADTALYKAKRAGGNRVMAELEIG